jgi:ATP-dependent DNA helicase RecQ
LQSDSEAHGALKLTDTARGVLKGETQVMLREQGAALSSRRAARAGSKRGTDASSYRSRNSDVEQSNLLRVLRAWRSEIARQRGVPAYVVLHDATLEGIATSRPATLSQLHVIPGIGEKKLERYGDALLMLVNSASGGS